MKIQDPSFKYKVASIPGGETLLNCFQCGVCTSSCPYSVWLDWKPHQVMRLAILGFKDEVLDTDMLWICSSCYACTVRCPQGVDVKEVMDVLRRMALLDKGFVRDEKRFYTEFLDLIKRYGRLNTMRMFLRVTGLKGFTENLKLGFSLFSKGKIKLFPGKLKGQREVEEIFEKTVKEEVP